MLILTNYLQIISSFSIYNSYNRHLIRLNANKGKRGIFSPLVDNTKKILGEKELQELRAKIILEHSKVISKFIDTSDSKFGKLALKTLFKAADLNNDGSLEFNEVKSACIALGFEWLDDEKARKLFIKSDLNADEVIDFEEFAISAPKILKTNLVKLAKKNGNDLGFLV